MADYDGTVTKLIPKHTAPKILCCHCGNAMVMRNEGSTGEAGKINLGVAKNSGAALCDDCIMAQIDITENIPKSAAENILTICKNCAKVSCPPGRAWIIAPQESRERLALCLKKIKGLTSSDVRLVDAQFLWTEPHSRRNKVKVTVRGESPQFPNITVQQDCVVEFTEGSGQCPDCAKSFTANKWTAQVQVRQKVDHKKTFFYLEQLILKSRMDDECISIEEAREGLNFLFASKHAAARFSEFVGSVVPCRIKQSEELVSTDTHTGHSTFKFTFSIDIVPICREDLIVLSKKQATQVGLYKSRVVLCYKIGSAIHLIDPNSLRTADVTQQQFFRDPFTPVVTSTSGNKALTKFMVLDCEIILDPSVDVTESFSHVSAKHKLAEVTLARESDLGVNDQQYVIRTHIGAILQPGDTALGYFMANTNVNHDQWESMPEEQRPDVVLVKKYYGEKKKSKKNRSWKLRRMATEYNEADDNQKNAHPSAPGGAEYEEFLNELEQDPELRGQIDMYARDVENGVEETEEVAEDDGEDEEDDGDYDSELDVKLDELKLEDMDEEHAGEEVEGEEVK